MTTSTSLKIIFVIWLISTAFATYAASPYSHSYGFLTNGGILCPDDYSLTKRNKEYQRFCMQVWFFFPP